MSASVADARGPSALRLSALRSGPLATALVMAALALVAAACSSGDDTGASSDTTGAETTAATVDGLETTSVPSPTLTADGGEQSTSEATSEETSSTSDAPDPVDNPMPGCEPGDARIDVLAEPLSPELDQVRQAILEAHAACDLDQLLALTDPSALLSEPGDEVTLVLNFGDQEPTAFEQLPFDVLPELLNGPWTTTRADDGTELVGFSNGSHDLQISADGFWTAFLVVVS